MKPGKQNARWIGILYIIGTVFGILSVVFTTPIQNSPDYFSSLPANESQLAIGALCVLIMGLALALIPAVFYPTGKKHHPVFATGYVIFRGALETFTYLMIVFSWLFLLSLRHVPDHAGVLASMNFQALGEHVLAGGAISTVTTIVFILGALMFYAILYQTKLVPRWISVWGLVGAVPYLAAGFLVMFTITGHMSTIDTLLRVPLAIQEMVLAVWLIVKGFNTPTIPPKKSNV